MIDAAATAEFLDSLSFNHRIIYRRRKTSNALRNKNKFRLPWNQYGSEGIPIEFAKTLWKKLFPMWVHHTLHSPSFEVFRTPNMMGLGLCSKINNSTLSAMACEVDGFLEYITEEEEVQQI